jgi:hypothetical protein
MRERRLWPITLTISEAASALHVHRREIYDGIKLNQRYCAKAHLDRRRIKRSPADDTVVFKIRSLLPGLDRG